MAKKENGFCIAETDNLPKVSEEMIIDFFKENMDFLSTEIKGVKAQRSAQSSYADNAVGYVQLQRIGGICTVMARITPEHKIRKRAYSVTLVCDESKESLLSVQCDGCAANQGGCKHSIAFLFWVHRKCSLPSTTEKECYWKKSSLSCVGSTQKFIHAQKLGKKTIKSLPQKTPATLQKFADLLKEKNINDLQISSLITISDVKENLSLHFLKLNYSNLNVSSTPDEFLNFVSSKMSTELCREAAEASVAQANSSVWHELRYARVTASKMHEASRCNTAEGSLVEYILGAKFKVTDAIKRGRLLEEQVLTELKKHHKVSILPCGFLLDSQYPFSGASPDGISKDFIVEIKCPSTEKTMVKYFKNNLPSDKHYAQMQTQMLFAKKKQGLFCVAHPDFESSKLFTEIWVDFNEKFCNELMSKSEAFWKSAIFPRL